MNNWSGFKSSVNVLFCFEHLLCLFIVCLFNLFFVLCYVFLFVSFVLVPFLQVAASRAELASLARALRSFRAVVILNALGSFWKHWGSFRSPWVKFRNGDSS